jgi:hypothetical protein
LRWDGLNQTTTLKNHKPEINVVKEKKSRKNPVASADNSAGGGPRNQELARTSA